MKNKGKTIAFVILAIVVFFLGNNVAQRYQSLDGIFYERFANIFTNFFADFRFTINGPSALTGVFAIFLLFAFWFYNFGNRKNDMPGEEHGSAQWGKPTEARPFESNKEYGNILLSKNVGLDLSNEGKDYDYHTNKNVLVLGGSGSGKTRFFVKPNILQKHSCYIVTDPKGTCLAEVGNALKDDYEIKYFNTVDLTRSMHYNPLEYAQSEQDILKLVDALILNTTSPDSRSGEQFWQDAEKLLYTAVIAYIMFDATDEWPKNFNTFLELFGRVRADESHPDDVTILDVLFQDLTQENLDNGNVIPFSARCYEGFKKAPPETAAGVIISACARLMPFYIADLRNLFAYDEMELDHIGFKKTAHFLIVDDTDSTFDFMVGLLYSQMFTRMIRNADKNDGKLNIHTRLIMDEAANIAQIRNLEKVTGQIRSREISACLIYQNPEQLKAMYKEKAAVITGNFDTTLFLGSEESSVSKLISEKIGDTTVNYTTKTETRGRNGSFAQNEGITKRRLLTPEEVRKLSADECIVFVKGLPPIRDKKFRLEKHPRFNQTADHDRNLLYKLNTHEQEQTETPGSLQLPYEERKPEYTITSCEQFSDGMILEVVL